MFFTHSSSAWFTFHMHKPPQPTTSHNISNTLELQLILKNSRPNVLLQAVTPNEKWFQNIVIGSDDRLLQMDECCRSSCPALWIAWKTISFNLLINLFICSDEINAGRLRRVIGSCHMHRCRCSIRVKHTKTERTSSIHTYTTWQVGILTDLVSSMVHKVQI